MTEFIEHASTALRGAGCRIEAPGRIEGVSGVTHEVDMLCSSKTGKILVDIRREDVAVGATAALSLYVKMLDTKCSKATLIAVPRACTLAKKIAQSYGITLVEAEDPTEAIASLKEKVFQAPLPEPATNLVPSEVGGADATRAQAVYARRIRIRSIKSALDLLVLLFLDRTPSTGYDVISNVHSRFKILLSPGTVYPILKRLAKEGLVTATDMGRKKIYLETQKGRLVSNVAIQEYENIQSELLSYLQFVESSQTR